VPLGRTTGKIYKLAVTNIAFRAETPRFIAKHVTLSRLQADRSEFLGRSISTRTRASQVIFSPWSSKSAAALNLNYLLLAFHRLIVHSDRDADPMKMELHSGNVSTQTTWPDHFN
jgi:hypothetical protein